MTEVYKKWSFSISSILLFAALIGAEKWPAMLSIAMAVNLLSIIIFTHPLKLISNFWHNKGAFLFACATLFLLTSFFYTSNNGYLLERLQIKLPLALYAMVLPSLGKLCIKQIKTMFYGYTSIIVITSIGILTNYLLHFEAINQMYLESKIMPTPINHIRYSLMVVFGIYLIYFILKTYWNQLSKAVQNLMILALLLLFFFIHIYSVRSGLLALYLVIAATFANQFFIKKNIRNSIWALLLIAMVALASFLVSPTMRNKFANTSHDVGVIKTNQDPNYNSLATRVVSYKIALKIWQQNKLIGCSQGDLWDNMQRYFKSDYPTIKEAIIPHNQFIYYLAATGIIGLILFATFFYAPLYLNNNFKAESLAITYLIISCAFMFEAMIESQLGVACTVIFLFWGSILANKTQNALTA